LFAYVSLLDQLWAASTGNQGASTDGQFDQWWMIRVGHCGRPDATGFATMFITGIGSMTCLDEFSRGIAASRTSCSTSSADRALDTASLDAEAARRYRCHA